MATENPLTLVNSDGGGTQNWSTGSSSLGYGSASGDSSEQDLRLLLRGQKFRSSREMFPNRSGSAPPTFEGSLAALGGILPDDISGLNSPQGSMQNSEEQLKLESEVTSSYYLQSHHPRLHRDWHSVGQRLAGLGDKRKLRSFDDSNSSFLFFSRPLLPTHKEEPEEDRSPRSNLIRQSSSDWAEARLDSIAGLSLPSLGGWPKSLVDRIQEDFPRTPSPLYNLSRSASHPANEEAFDSTSSLDVQQIHLRESTIAPGKSSEVGTGISVSRTGTPNPNPMHILGAPSVNNSSIASIASTNIPIEGNQLDSSGDIMGNQIKGLGGSDDGNARLESVLLGSVNTSDASEIVDALKNLNMKDVQNLDQYTHQKQQAKEEAEHSQSYQIAQIQQRSNLSSRQGQVQIQVSTQPLYQQSHSPVSQTSRNHPKHGSNLLQPSHLGMQPAVQPVGTPHLYSTAATYLPSGNPYLQNMQSAAMFATQYGIGGYPMNATLLSPLMHGYPAPGPMTFAFDNTAAALAASINARSSAAATPAGIGVGVDLQNLYKFGGQFGTTLHPHLTDPMYVHYVQRPAEDSYNVAMLNDPLSGRGFLGGTQVDNSELHKLSMLGYAAEQKPHLSRNGAVGLSMAGKTVPNPAFYGSPSNMGLIMQYPTPSLAPPLSPGSPSMATTNISARFGDRSIRYPLGSSKATVGVYSGWQAQGGNDKLGDMKCSSFLEELKNNRSRRFELSDIAGQVVEFSADQHGSRFIQQKLESASLEEKALVFQEVLPHASKLMTDVFGNYVIQKFFEHGTDQQRKELANQLSSRVLSLSLQMYGCRVVQKALEVVDVDQQMQLVLELNGHVLKCVRDQNGNHVIQKCIECVPTDRIEFMISAFYEQVVTLSTHPYGCRVIQRVLEHCTEEQKNSGIMKEILDSIFNLSEDQYGNYVAQHVLEHGMPHERSEIIKKLSGKIVQMSQHKFASNVVEKCLEYGDPKERELLIDELLGDSQENENLQAMMKDPFANYVVQKVLETCNSEQRDKLLSCIKEHSHALKKYTYGKHIVARAEKMLNSGEKQGLQ